MNPGTEITAAAPQPSNPCLELGQRPGFSRRLHLEVIHGTLMAGLHPAKQFTPHLVFALGDVSECHLRTEDLSLWVDRACFKLHPDEVDKVREFLQGTGIKVIESTQAVAS